MKAFSGAPVGQDLKQVIDADLAIDVQVGEASLAWSPARDHGQQVVDVDAPIAIDITKLHPVVITQQKAAEQEAGEVLPPLHRSTQVGVVVPRGSTGTMPVATAGAEDANVAKTCAGPR